jgi:hypothetical protein
VTLGIFKDLSLGRATGSRFLLGRLPALIFHLALVETHSRIVAERHIESRLYAGWRSAAKLLTRNEARRIAVSIAKLLTKDKARRIAANVAKLPELLQTTK